MSKYKAGDKVVVEIEKAALTDNGGGFYIVLDYMQSAISVDEKSEPLSTYTEPLEAKIKRQAAEITRLLRENNELKEQMKFDLPTLISEEDRRRMDISKARAEGAEVAWELARKIFDMETNDIEDIFITEDAWNLGTVLNNYTYSEAAAKVAEWEKAKEEIKVGDIIKVDVNGLYAIVTHESDEFANVVHADGNVYLGRKDGMTKTGRHIDVDGFLKQIGGE